MALTQFMIFRERLRGENQNTKFKIPFCICSGVLCVYVCWLSKEHPLGFQKSIRINYRLSQTLMNCLPWLAQKKKDAR